MSTKRLQVIDFDIKQAGNANTLGGKTPDEFASASDVVQLKEQVGDSSVSAQISDAINALTSENVDIYVQSDEPTQATEGALWIDIDAESVSEDTDTTLSISGKPADAKATGTAIAVERSRINNLVSSTTGDTELELELEDIRIGADGTEYESAGAAVREQISQLSTENAELKSDLVDLPKSKMHYSDFESLNEKSSKIRLVPNNNIGIIARLKKTDSDCYVNSIKLSCSSTDTEKENRASTVRIAKFKLSGSTLGSSTVTDLVIDTENVSYYDNNNDILLRKPFFVEEGFYIGLYFECSAGNAVALYQIPNEQFENSGCVFLDSSNTSVSNAFLNYTQIIDFEIVNKAYIDSHQDPLRGLRYVAYGDSITAGYGCDGFHNRENMIFDNNKSMSYVRMFADKHAMKFNNYGLAGYGFSRQQEINYADSLIENYHDSNVDIVTIAYGTNDFGASDSLEFGTINDRYTELTFCGKVRSALYKLTDYYPTAKIFVILPIAREGMNVANSKGKTLIDYVRAIEDIAEQLSIPTINMLKKSNFNVFSQTFRTTYYLEGGTSSESLHPKQIAHEKFILPIVDNFISNSFEK